MRGSISRRRGGGDGAPADAAGGREPENERQPLRAGDDGAGDGLDVENGLESAEKSSEEDVVSTGASATDTVCNIVKNVVGSGLLSLPRQFWLAQGMEVAGPLLFFMGLVFGVSFWLLGVTAGAVKSRKKNCATYGDIWASVGGHAPWVGDLCLMVNGTTTACSYMVVAASLIPHGLPFIFDSIPNDTSVPALQRVAALLPVCALIFPVYFLFVISLETFGFFCSLWRLWFRC